MVNSHRQLDSSSLLYTHKDCCAGADQGAYNCCRLLVLTIQKPQVSRSVGAALLFCLSTVNGQHLRSPMFSRWSSCLLQLQVSYKSKAHGQKWLQCWLMQKSGNSSSCTHPPAFVQIQGCTHSSVVQETNGWNWFKLQCVLFTNQGNGDRF